MPAFVQFQVSEKPLAIKSTDVQEILAMPALVQSPGAPEIFAGFLNLGGKIISCIRLDVLFGLPKDEIGANSRLIITKEVGAQQIALVADRVNEVVEAETGQIHCSEEGSTLNNCSTEDLQKGDQTIPILNVGNLLLKEEAEKVAEIKIMYERRVNNLDEPQA